MSAEGKVVDLMAALEDSVNAAKVARVANERDRLRAEVDHLRDLLAKALPWIDPNDRHEDYLLTVEIRQALGEES